MNEHDLDEAQIDDTIKLDDLSYEDLTALCQRVEDAIDANSEVMARCLAQIDGSKARAAELGQHDDPEWYVRVKTRVRYAGHEDQRLKRFAGKIRRVIRSLDHQRRLQATATAGAGNDPLIMLEQAIELLKGAIILLRRA